MFFGLISFAIYVVSAFAFYKLAKIRGIQYPWMAFIPFFSLYITGYIADTLKYNNRYLNQYLANIPLAYALPLISLVSSFSWSIPLLGGLLQQILALLLYAGQILTYYLVFDHYTAPDQKVLFTILSIIPVVGPLLILYSLRDYDNY